MPANYPILRQLIRRSMPSFFEFKKRAILRAEDATRLLIAPVISHDNLRARSDDLFHSMARVMRWAGPADEPYFEQFSPGEMPDEITLIAADGSQRLPDPTIDGNILEGVLWGMTNVGAITWQRRAGHFLKPEEHIDTTLFFEDELLTTNNVQKTEGDIFLLRDIHERQFLAELAARYGPNTLGLLDSEIEVWGAKSSEIAGDYQASLRQVTAIYEKLRDQNIAYIGYIDSARSKLLVRLLEIAVGTSDLRKAGRQPLFYGVTDEMVLKHWLPAGQRTALFRLCTQSQGAFSDSESLRPYICYLNVGTVTRPHITRANLPGWLLSDKVRVGQILALLFDQCKKSGGLYPWILHRSHEVAVIKLDEHEAIRQMIMAEYLRYERAIPDQSPKEELKRLSRRKRK